jgi:predicted nuclease with TOPRIM domain
MTLADLHPYGNLLASCGALLIFFSWLATNTLGEKFKRAETEFETAREKQHLYHTLDDIQASARGLAGQVGNLHRDCQRLAASLDPWRDEQAVRDQQAYDELRLDLVSTIVNADQIDRGKSFVDIVLDRQDPSTKTSVSHKQILEISAKLSDLLKEKKAVVEQMQANLARYAPSGAVSMEDVRNEHRRLNETYRVILQPFGPLLQTAADATNARERELRTEYSKAKSRSTKANRASIFLYIIGTALVLIGTALDKLVQ